MRQPQDHFYLVEIQDLGFRYHGWQKQPGVKTVQLMIEKTINYVLGDQKFKVLSAGRTDAMVSVQKTTFQLMLRTNIDDMEEFLKQLNLNLPADIRALSINPIRTGFNIIQDVVQKEYHYLFTFGQKMHPFCAPFMANFHATLDIDSMMSGAEIFEGEHNFRSFCEYDNADKDFTRIITSCTLQVNNELTANFFPEKSYLLKIKGKGFLRYQVRYMMGALLKIGEGTLTIKTVENALKTGAGDTLSPKAPASGLVLADVTFDL